MKITKIYPVGKFKIIQIIGTIDGTPTARCIAPWDDKTKQKTDISNEPQEVQDACNAAWTDGVIEAYEAHKEAAI